MRTYKAFLAPLFAIALTGSASAQTTVVTLSFDDTYDDQAQVGDMLATRSFHATFFVNSPRIDQTGYMTSAQVKALQDAGNEIGGHTVDHLILSTVPADEQRRQICDDRAHLLQMGFNVTSFAYPHGASDLADKSIVTDCGYNSARDASSLRSHDPETCTACAYAETMPPMNGLAIRTPVAVKSTITLADLEQNVTDAEAHGGGWVPFVFHHVCDGCNDLSISATTLGQFMDFLAARGGMGTTVKTFQDVINGPLNAAVTGPVPTQYVATDGNFLRNGSLDTDADMDGVPDCFNIGSGGALATAFTSGPAPTAHSGSFAEQLSVVTAPASPRILSGQDLGACSPIATPGHTYNVSAWYQASNPVLFVVYYRNAMGWWKYWTKSTALAPTTDWAQATWTTPAVPSDATALSFGLAVNQQGTLAADDLFFADTAGPPPAPTPGADGGTTPTGNDDGGTTPTGSNDGGTTTNGDADGGTQPASSSKGGCDMGGMGGSVPMFSLVMLMLGFYAARKRTL